MALKWNCLEPLTAIGIGVGACAMAPIDAGLTAGAVIGGAGLLSRLKQNSRQAGLDDEKLVARVQKKLLGELKHWDQAEEREAAERADAAMQTLLPQVMLRRDQLAATVTQARERDERYPVLAARLVVDELARHDPMFEQPRAGASQRYERVFALQAVEAALRSGMNDPDYATLLTLDIAIELGAAIRETIDAIQTLHDKVERGFAAVQQELAQIKAQGPSDNAKLARLSEKAMRGAIARFVAFSPRAGTEDIVQAVEEFAEDYERLRDRVRKLDAHDNRVRGLQQAAEQALEADGDIEEARRLLREATELRREAALAPVKDAAETQAALAEADLAALDWESAAANWRTAASMLAPFDATAAGDLGNTAGNALRAFGEKYGGGALEAAVVALRATMEIQTHEDRPIAWAMTQGNLGIALKNYGAMIGGEDGDKLIGEAVEAFRHVLEVFTGEEMPDEWAQTQNNLGAALTTRGQRLEGQDGNDLLSEAVAAFRAALELHTRYEHPVEWALTQNNLGVALLIQGERLIGQAGTNSLGEAVAAFREALEVRTREDMPDGWAVTQNNLGAALARRGERVEGQEAIALMGGAITAFRSTLEVRALDDLPVDWALTQENIGLALESLADCDLDRRWQHLQEAREAVTLSLEVFDPENMPFNFEKAKKCLARIEAKIAEHCSDD